MEIDHEYNCYCLFVRSGSELEVADSINERGGPFAALAPVRKIHEKRRGEWTERTKALLPGYVFVYADKSIQDPYTKRVDHMYRILRYDSEMHRLLGTDLEYALWIMKNDGEIGCSKILELGDEIRVIEGPLLDCMGKVVRLDKHKRRATVKFDFDGKIRTVSLSAYIVTDIKKEDGQEVL